MEVSRWETHQSDMTCLFPFYQTESGRWCSLSGQAKMCQLLNGVSRELGLGSRATKEQIGKFNDTSAHHRALVWNHQTHSSDWGCSVSSDYLFSLMPSACPVFSSLITLFLPLRPPCCTSACSVINMWLSHKPNYVDLAQGSLSV